MLHAQETILLTIFCSLVIVGVQDNIRTKDLGGSASTADFARAVAHRA